MKPVIKLQSFEHLGTSDFLSQLDTFNLTPSWNSFSLGFRSARKGLNAVNGGIIEQVFCHLYAIPVLIGNEIYLSRVPKLSGYIARQTEIVVALTQLDICSHWKQASVSSTYCLIDDAVNHSQGNSGFFWLDIDRYCTQVSLRLHPLCGFDLPEVLSIHSLVKSSSLHPADLPTILGETVCRLINREVNIVAALQALSSKFSPTRVLFVCTANIQRSLTAEHLFKSMYPLVQFKSAGVSRKECSRNNSTLCTDELLSWADVVFVFEQMHLDRIQEHTGTRFGSKIVNLEVDDIYQYMQPTLVELLIQKLRTSLGEI